MTISIVSLVVATIALTINLSGLVRRPRIVAEWGDVSDGHEYQPPVEGLTVVVTARRRPLQVDEVGLVVVPRRTWPRRVPEWLHEDRPYRWPLGLREGTPANLT